MPYIKQETRSKIKPDLDKIMESIYMHIDKSNEKGTYNFIITSLIHNYIESKGLNYNAINDAIGILESVKLELYTTVVREYENKAIEKNGKINIINVKE